MELSRIGVSVTKAPIHWTINPVRIPLRRAFQFFLQHGGGWVGHQAESALKLARAESWAQSEDLEYVWGWDDDGEDSLGDHAYWCATARRRARKYSIPKPERIGLSFECDHEVLTCRLVRPCPDHGVDCRHSDTLESLGGIIDPDRAYRRVVEAELASEAMPEYTVRQTLCRHCGLDIEGSSRTPFPVADWRDRGNNTHCPAPAGEVQQIHESID